MDTNDGHPVATPHAGGGLDSQRPADRPPTSPPAGPSGPAGQPHRGHGRRPPGQGGDRPVGDHRDDRRRRDGKHGSDRKSFAGFGDEIERAFCDAAVHLLPETFPVLHRQGAATLRVVTVATRSGAILLCDGAHPGPHRWPSGDEVADVTVTSSRPPTSAVGVDAVSSNTGFADNAPPADDQGDDDA